MSAFDFREGHVPLLVSIPHVGTNIPPYVGRYLTEAGRRLTDTDWHLNRLYDFLGDMGASVLMAHHSRTVIDLNRPADGSSLYPGQSVTELCPTTGFDNQPLYIEGGAPDKAEIQRRKEACWQPYHDKLRAELDRMKTQFGYALLWDAHSIQSQVPRFFEGRLPDLNLGNGGGTSCAPELSEGLPHPHPIVRFSTDGSRAAISPAITATPRRTSMPFNWKYPRLYIWMKLPASSSVRQGPPDCGPP